MKPMPVNKQEMQSEASELGLMQGLLKVSESGSVSPRAKLLQFIYNSWMVGRSYNSTIMMVLGVSGSGKSATINHLLGVDYAKTSTMESETKSTTEFIVTAQDPSLEVSNLSLRIVDTPGWDDTEGPGQDACNLFSIMSYCKRSALSECKPNVILLVIQATDTRFSGKSSRFYAALEVISTLGLVDRQHPNVVVAVTWACSLPRANVEKWKAKANAKNNEIRKIVMKTLKVDPSVVWIENEYVENELVMSDDKQQSRLPDGRYQPNNLYNAIADQLEANNDMLGLMTFSRFFQLSLTEEKTCVQGLSVAAKHASKEILNANETKILNKLIKDKFEGSLLPEVTTKINEYIDTHAMDEDNRNEAQQICTDLVERLGLQTMQDMQEHSVASLCSLLKKNPSQPCINMLTDTFRLLPRQTKPAAFVAVGTGYNILNDEMKPFALFKMEEPMLVDAGYGFKLPRGMALTYVQDTRTFMMQFEQEVDYIHSRLTNLNVNMAVDVGVFKMKAKSGFSWGGSSQGKASTLEFSYLYEKRVFKAEIKDMTALVLMDSFQKKVNSLPVSYDKENVDNRAKFEQFFDTWGHFVIASAYGGGSVDVKCQTLMSGSRDSSFLSARVEIEAEFRSKTSPTDALSTPADKSLKIGTSHDRDEKIDVGASTKLTTSNLMWSGGNTAYHKTSMTNIVPDEWKKWEASLVTQPAMLTTEMSLIPIYELVEQVDPTKMAGCRNALKEILGGQFTIYKQKEKDKQKEKEEAARKEISDRAEEAKRKREKALDTSNNSSCFPGSSFLHLRGSDEPKLMSELCIGDEVLSFAAGKLVYSPVYMFAHRDAAKLTSYLEFHTEEGFCITASPKHMIQINKTDEVKFSDQIKIGDKVLHITKTLDGFQMAEGKVQKIKHITKCGYYAPFTLSGTIVVNDVLASCYANVPSLGPVSAQSLAHVGVAPLRAAYCLGLHRFLNINDGMHMPMSIKRMTGLFKPLLEH